MKNFVKSWHGPVFGRHHPNFLRNLIFSSDLLPVSIWLTNKLVMRCLLRFLISILIDSPTSNLTTFDFTFLLVQKFPKYMLAVLPIIALKQGRLMKTNDLSHLNILGQEGLM